MIQASQKKVTVATSDSARQTTTAGRLGPDGETGFSLVGDWVALDARAGTAVFRAILPRSGELIRRRVGAAERQQTVAANVSSVLIVESADRGPNRRRIERAVFAVYGGCALRSAVEAGSLDSARLKSYHKLRREAETHELRHDTSRRHEQSRVDRSFAKICRRAVKRKGLK